MTSDLTITDRDDLAGAAIRTLAMDAVQAATFGASAPLKDLVSRFGFTPEAVLATARAQIARHALRSTS